MIVGITPTLTTQIVNAGPGDQTDPHVSGDWAAYTSDDFVSIRSIRYYNFSTNTDAQIPMGSSAHDMLSDISGSKIVFARTILGVSTAIMVFDAANPAAFPIEIDPEPGTTRLGSAIGGNTVAYVDYGLDFNGELVIHDLITSNSVRVTNDIAFDQNPSVSPDGNSVVWEHCATSMTNCDIWQAVKSGAGWSVSAASETPNPEGNPGTNGTLVVYDVSVYDVSLPPPGQSAIISWRPLTGGAENRLQIAGFSYNPSIVGNIIAFENRGTGAVDRADIFVYDIASNQLYQITNTPLVSEQLNDITVLPDGRLRVVWASDEDGTFQRNVHAATFTLPPSAPSPADLIQQLLDKVALFNLRQGISNSLDAKLDNAQAALTSAKSGKFANACGMLGAFINEVQAQSGKAITSAQAAQLLDLANQARAGLSCP